MSYSANRRDSLNVNLALVQRASHLRSCAVLVAEKFGVKRSVVLDLIKARCGVDPLAIGSEAEIGRAIEVLDDLKTRGLDAQDG
jgi:hypothetical protein